MNQSEYYEITTRIKRVNVLGGYNSPRTDAFMAMRDMRYVRREEKVAQRVLTGRGKQG